MQTIINTTGIKTVDYINTLGKFTGVRFISKCRAGFLTVVDAKDWDIEMYNEKPENLVALFLKGALQTVEVQFESMNTVHWFTVFARVGKKIHLIDEAILADLTVGTINSCFPNTDLYSQAQYNMVGASSWASKAFVANKPAMETV